MGDMADDAYYTSLIQSIEYEAQEESDRDRDAFDKDMWRGKDKTYKISEMDIGHLSNCIKLIKSLDGWRKYYLTRLEERLDYLKNGRWNTTPFQRKKHKFKIE